MYKYSCAIKSLDKDNFETETVHVSNEVDAVHFRRRVTRFESIKTTCRLEHDDKLQCKVICIDFVCDLVVVPGYPQREDQPARIEPTWLTPELLAA